MPLRRLFDWIFYGHIWIALGAMSLSWLSLRITFGASGCVNEDLILSFVFFATLGVYTLHRYLSFRRAGGLPKTLRYGIVAKHPRLSLFIGSVSMLLATGLGLFYLEIIWPAILCALPITVFYLTPPLQGWRRLRDLPYLKNLWVAIAWTIMTAVVPVIMFESEAIFYRQEITGSEESDLLGLINQFSCLSPAPLNYPNFFIELAIRFLFTGCIALLFDLRDLTLDRSQNVSTVAGELPKLHRVLVYSCLAICASASLWQFHFSCIIPSYGTALFIAYLVMVPVAYKTYRMDSENWFAVVVNGLLLLPWLAYLLFDIWGADAGAIVGL